MSRLSRVVVCNYSAKLDVRSVYYSLHSYSILTVWNRTNGLWIRYNRHDCELRIRNNGLWFRNNGLWIPYNRLWMRKNRLRIRNWESVITDSWSVTTDCESLVNELWIRYNRLWIRNGVWTVLGGVRSENSILLFWTNIMFARPQLCDLIIISVCSFAL